jgi:dockerin type I repeat protein
MTQTKEKTMAYAWRTLTAAVVLAALVGARVAGAACGDVNGDGKVDVSDALALSNLVAGGSVSNVCGTGIQNDCADLFKDGHVDNADLAVLVAHVAGLKTLFDICTGPGPEIKCTGAPDDTGHPTATIKGQTITTSQTWPANCTVDLTGIVFVQSPTTGPTTVITMKPGVIVKGLAGGTANPAVLIFLPGSKIDAQGTPSKPIIMTSGQPVGSRQTGDWGGLLLNGKSTVNRPNCQNTAEGIPAPYGGCDATDSSGIMTYTRVEFSGIEFTPNNELNVITLNGVGNGTVIHHIQANAGGDDCIEWFGGTVNVKYFVSSGCADDGFDWQLGTTGARQYGFFLSYGPFLQTGNQSRGIEADNSEFGFDDLPRSNPKFCNLTMIGARDNDPNLGSQGGLFFRRGTAGTVANSIVTNFRGSGINLNDTATAGFACDNSTTLKTSDPFLLVENTLFFDNGGTGARGTGSTQIAGFTSGTANCTPAQWYGMLTSTKNVTPPSGVGQDPHIPTRHDDVLATGPYPTKLPNVVPSSTAGFPPATDCHAIDDFMETTNYIGAFDPNGGASANWLDTGSGTDRFTRWISFDVN